MNKETYEAIAERALLLILALLYPNEIQTGDNAQRTVADCRFALIGTDPSRDILVRLLNGFGAHVFTADTPKDLSNEELSSYDYVSIHPDKTDEHWTIDTKFFERCNSHVYFVSSMYTDRTDIMELIAAQQSGEIAGAGLHVAYKKEIPAEIKFVFSW